MGDILKEITPLLGKHGIVIFQSETGRAMFDGDNVVAVEYAFTVAHASGEIWPPIKQTGASRCRNSKDGWDDKSLNKCHTAARKYFLLALCQIPTGNEEDDADKGENDRPAQVPAVVRRVRSVAPEYVVPPPSRRLKEGGIADRAMVARAHQSWAKPPGPSKPFLASEAGKFDECNPPPHHAVPDHAAKAAAALNRQLHPMRDELPGDLAPPLDRSERDSVPGFLDRRRPVEVTERTFADLVQS